jgi:hypothetical protein
MGRSKIKIAKIENKRDLKVIHPLTQVDIQ